MKNIIQEHWKVAFSYLVELCKIKSNEKVIVLTETSSRLLNVSLVELALKEHSLKYEEIEIPSKPYAIDPIIRSTGATNILDDHNDKLQILKVADIIFDLSKEGLMHSKQTKEILSSGARIMNISNEHPDILARLKPELILKEIVKDAVSKCRNASFMTVKSESGTHLEINLNNTNTVGVWGWTDRPGTLAHWPGGLVVSFPNKASVNGKLLFQPGDMNLTFKKYFESEVIFNIENDFVTNISGRGSDAKLIKNYLTGFGDKNAYATSHVGWGLNKKARYEALTMYDKSELNGTELRSLSGSFLYSIGANEFANRFTDGHFDIPMMDCTILLDNKIVVDKGVVI